VAISPWLGDVVRDPARSWSLVIAGVATVVPGVWELRSDPELRRQWTRSGRPDKPDVPGVCRVGG
jgi:hypothetical protein